MKKLGFGCMRLPMMGGADGEVDKREFCRMVDTFLAEGFCYFDTAHGYLNGKSETALRECLTARYPRESYILTDKLTSFFFEKEDDILPLFEQQLEKTGVSYFDYYLLHALNGAYYEKFTRCNAFEIVKQLKEQGRVKHIGISFHDKPALLERVLDEHPEIEVVQIQFNYADYENPSIESRAVYEVCRRHQKPVIVMEPVKGGGLIQLPEEAKAVLDGVGTGSYASYAVRYAKTKPARDGLKAQKTEKARSAYRERHESDFIIADAATRYFRAHAVSKLPSHKALQAEIEQLTAEKNAHYNEYREKKARVKELHTVKNNLSQILQGEKDREKKHEHER